MHYGEKAILKKYAIAKLFSMKEHNYFLPPPRYWAWFECEGARNTKTLFGLNNIIEDITAKVVKYILATKQLKC